MCMYHFSVNSVDPNMQKTETTKFQLNYLPPDEFFDMTEIKAIASEFIEQEKKANEAGPCEQGTVDLEIEKSDETTNKISRHSPLDN
jgi:hypothetical protein